MPRLVTQRYANIERNLTNISVSNFEQQFITQLKVDLTDWNWRKYLENEKNSNNTVKTPKAQ